MGELSEDSNLGSVAELINYHREWREETTRSYEYGLSTHKTARFPFGH